MTSYDLPAVDVDNSRHRRPSTRRTRPQQQDQSLTALDASVVASES